MNELSSITAEQRKNLMVLIDSYEHEKQVDLKTEHHLYAGVYSRTIHIPAGTLVVSVLITRTTQLVISGKGIWYDGNDQFPMQGYLVLEGTKNRQGAFHAIEDTHMTMFFATDAKTVEEAETEFTNEPEKLMTRKENLLCQEQQ